jgi:hypothetical protein
MAVYPQTILKRWFCWMLYPTASRAAYLGLFLLLLLCFSMAGAVEIHLGDGTQARPAIHASSAYAAACRSMSQVMVCLVDVKRSAKYYWEYRVRISIDGVQQPMVRYNCRERIQTQPDGTTIAITDNSVGDWVCRLVHHAS